MSVCCLAKKTPNAIKEVNDMLEHRRFLTKAFSKMLLKNHKV
jgi:hypothetical protein